MKIFETIHRPATTIGPAQTITEAAEAMEQHGVGALVVVDAGNVVGIVTDRDLVRRGLARRIPADARVDSLMSMPVVTIDADVDLHDAYAKFRTHPVRRLVVVNRDELVGIVTIDDLLVYTAGDLSDLVRPVTAEILFSHHNTPVPATTSTS